MHSPLPIRGTPVSMPFSRLVRRFGRSLPLFKTTTLTAEDRFAVAAVAALTLAGLPLRLFCARGDLWLDEIWSLQSLEHISHSGEIFYAISQDNNHFLNSL